MKFLKWVVTIVVGAVSCALVLVIFLINRQVRQQERIRHQQAEIYKDPGYPIAPAKRDAIFARERLGIVHIRVEQRWGHGSGTGTFISSDGLLATNHHVVVDALQGRAKAILAG
jgi:S1-C subfamily serine protease